MPAISVRKYSGKQIAILNGKIIVSAKNLEELLNKIKKAKKINRCRNFKFFQSLKLY